MRKDFIRKVKAALLTSVVLTALTIFIMLLVGIVNTIVDIDFTLTFSSFKEAFLGAGCGIGLAAVYEDMLEYLKD